MPATRNFQARQCPITGSPLNCDRERWISRFDTAPEPLHRLSASFPLPQSNLDKRSFGKLIEKPDAVQRRTRLQYSTLLHNSFIAIEFTNIPHFLTLARLEPEFFFHRGKRHSSGLRREKVLPCYFLLSKFVRITGEI
jgi:hypothetical protein